MGHASPNRRLGELVLEPLDSTLQALPEEELGSLFDYPRKSRVTAWILWLLTGFLGGHRLYLGRIGTALLMLITGRGRIRELVGDVAVLLLTGVLLGAASLDTGDYKGLAVVAGMVFMLNLPAGLYRWRELPLVGGLVRWDLRLHAFYHNHAPGNALARLARPVTGWITSIFRPRNWTETRLYLQLGVAASMLFGLVDFGRDVATPYLLQGTTVNPLEAWTEGVAITMVVIFFFTVPIGATLVKCSLLDRPRGEAWALSALTAVAVLIGLLAG